MKSHQNSATEIQKFENFELDQPEAIKGGIIIVSDNSVG